jgi:hypothetical protein
VAKIDFIIDLETGDLTVELTDVRQSDVAALDASLAEKIGADKVRSAAKVTHVKPHTHQIVDGKDVVKWH